MRFESALTDVVVAGRAREGKVVGHQGLKLTLVLLLHALYNLRDQFLVCRMPSVLREPWVRKSPAAPVSEQCSQFERLPP